MRTAKEVRGWVESALREHAGMDDESTEISVTMRTDDTIDAVLTLTDDSDVSFTLRVSDVEVTDAPDDDDANNDDDDEDEDEDYGDPAGEAVGEATA